MNTSSATVLSTEPLNFEELFRAHFTFACRTLRRLGVQERDLGDVAQELFLAVHGQLDAWDRKRPVKPWLAGFCLRFASNYRQLARHRGTSLNDVMAASTHDRHDDSIAARQAVLRILEGLEFDQRTALVLHDMEGLTAVEIAELTSAPLPTVYSRVRLARERARKILASLEEGGAS